MKHLKGELEMKKSRKFVTKSFGTAMLLTALTATTAFGGSWSLENGAWRYRTDSGQTGSGWINDNGTYYYTDSNGFMQTGWYQDNAQGGFWYYLMPEQGAPQGAMKTGWLQNNGKWYFLDTRAGGPQGSMLTGWQWIDGYCYYLDPAQGGAMASSCTTPDGYLVNASGAWVDENGNPHYEAGKGISSVSSSAASTSGETVSFGGGSSSGGGSSHSSNTVYDDDEWENYSDSSVSRSANDFTTGNYGMMDSDEKAEVKSAIEDFKDTYITDDMNDFEKEIMIIKWLVANCSYESTDDWSNSTAYSCIINGEAQCAGYADAFLQTAKACGLEARYVYNTTHAWNLVKIEGDWYHVDVTWEDPIGSNSYGFSKLRNKYINLEDSQVKGIRSHNTWSPSTIKANGTDYGPSVVAQYLKDGTIDTSKGESFVDQMNDFFDKVANEDGSNMITYTSVNETSEKICSYLEKGLAEKNESFSFVIRYPSKYSAQTTGNYSKLVDINNEIEDAVNNKINSKYSNVLKNPLKISLYLKVDADARYYAHETGKFYYQDGQGKMVDYTIRFVDTKGNEVGTQTGKGEKGKSISLVFPEGYSWISNSSANYKVHKGEAHYSGTTFRITGTEPVEMDVRLRVKKTQTTVNTASPSEARY